MDALLEKVKQNLILDHAADDALLKGYITAAVSYAESYQHMEVGENMIKGIGQGISSMASWLYDKASSLVNSVVSGVKSLLGIHSPSTVFAGIGENMGAGIGVGFVDAMKGVEEDMQKAIPTDFDVDASLDGMATAVGGGDRAFNVTIPLTIDGTTLARILAEIQWSQNAVYVRNLGTA